MPLTKMGAKKQKTLDTFFAVSSAKKTKDCSTVQMEQSSKCSEPKPSTSKGKEYRKEVSHLLNLKVQRKAKVPD